MPLQVFNSLSRSIEPFEPARPPRVTVYGCGPTVYNHVHIGNWLAFLFADVLVRWLEESGYQVEYVQNITDVEDKIIRDAQAAGEDRATFTERWTRVFQEGAQQLRFRDPDKAPRATDHVDGMVDMIQKLLDKGHAYLADDGSIYFRVTSFEDYGRLANLKPEELQAGASGRVKADEYEKDAVADFALWKGYEEGDGAVFWEPTFTIDGEAHVMKGRPGWHIECSVMATELLGSQLDLHLGGEDLLFPHHQNEIAQSEGALGKSPFVKYWMHNKHLMVEGTKMSKSKGNFYTLHDLIDQHGPEVVEAFRYLIVSSHYRTSLNFTAATLDAAGTTVKRLRECHQRLGKHAAGAEPSGFAGEAHQAFDAAMNDDLQTPAAVAAIHMLVGAANKGMNEGSLSPADAAAVVAFLEKADRVLGLFLEVAALELTSDQEALVTARAQARSDKDWAESDRLRDVLAEQGIAVKDTPDGQEVSRL